MRSSRRTTLRTAAVVTGAAAVLALPVGSAFADSPAVPEPEVLPGIEQPEVKPEVKKESSVRIGMPDGRIAKLVDGPNGKRVEISMPNGSALGTIDLKRPSTQNDGWTYKLVQDGKRVKFVVIDGKGGGNSWVYDFNGRLIEKYTVDGAKKDVVRKDVNIVPKGGVKAGAEGVTPSEGENPMLLAAGGGMASAGAAGLGFALLRRHRAGDGG
ncbi:hypothetical protein ACH4U5_17970 [Streptomyces sp. NPDC020858]|uniref:hypothetical protein n=1 Tax=Streptomyces sp. NPDC020858 TaxID=3365097 RepID=UPI0037B06263